MSDEKFVDVELNITLDTESIFHAIMGGLCKMRYADGTDDVLMVFKNSEEEVRGVALTKEAAVLMRDALKLFIDEYDELSPPDTYYSGHTVQ